MSEEYFLGLDLGTSSIGWAVTNNQYKILRAKGKDMWGIREFEEASTAQTRRQSRISRRARQRAQVRMGMLKSYFADALDRVDPDFLLRLENSKYFLEDKADRLKNKYAIFADDNYTDVEYYKEYPTIYHLIMDLIRHPEKKHDVRLVYLALVNLFKHRGHFYANLSTESLGENPLSTILERLQESADQLLDISLPRIDEDRLKEILSDRDCTRMDKSNQIRDLFQMDVKGDDKKKIESLSNGMVGLKINLMKLFPEAEKIAFSFGDTSFEEKEEAIREQIGDEGVDLLLMIRDIYEIGYLARILGDHGYLSEARCADYQKHKDDLKKLKKVIRLYAPEEYDNLFRSKYKNSDSAHTKNAKSDSEEISNLESYSAYINSCNTKGKKWRRRKRSTEEEFFKKIANILGSKERPKEVQENVYVQEILKDIDRGDFLPKMMTASNGAIPHQLHLKELRKILDNASTYLPFLNEIDESGLSVRERIEKIYSFCVPFYVGPLANHNGKGTGWIVRKEEGAILPWNIEQKVDMDRTREAFIKRLIRHCSYLANEHVLPKESLLYEKYCVLNELNQLKIRGEKLEVSKKQELFENLYKIGNRVKKRKLLNYMRNCSWIQEDQEVSGLPEELQCALSSYGKFKNIFGEDIERDEVKALAEEIIYSATIYGEDRREFNRQLRDHYKEQLSEDQIKKISDFRFRDWGRLSREFLEMEAVDQSSGKVISPMQALWSTSLTLNEILYSEQYNFQDLLQGRAFSLQKTLFDIDEEDLDVFYFSAPVKRMVWQTIKLVREITRIQGKKPSRIFVEMVRGKESKDNGKKKGTDSREKQLLELYNNSGLESKEKRKWEERIRKASQEESLRNKKIYLYLRQMGKDIYTGKEIDFEDLLNDKYDIDHIYPRSYVKDDSLANNLVLTNKADNSHIKGNSYPLPEKIRSRSGLQELWRGLLDRGFMSAEKYHRLTRRTSFTDEELAGFIARQIVETGQATKGVADILKEITGVRIIYSKASNVSAFRQCFKIPKSRLANDFHHAHDAYLNIVVGNVYDTKFTQDVRRYIKQEWLKNGETYHLGKIFERNVERNGYCAWDAGGDSIKTVKEMIARNSPLMTRLSLERRGQISDLTLVNHRMAKKENYLPIKSSGREMPVYRYGGYQKIQMAYFFLVEHDSNKRGRKRIRTIEGAPIYLRERLEKNEEALREFCEDSLGLINPSIRIPKIKIQSLIKINHYPYYLTGRSNSQLVLWHALNLKLREDQIDYIKKIEKYKEKGILDETITVDRNLELFNEMRKKLGQGIFEHRINMPLIKIKDVKKTFEGLSLRGQCSELYHVFELFALGAIQVDLRELKGSKNAGLLRINHQLDEEKQFTLVHQSITGIYEKEVDLNRV